MVNGVNVPDVESAGGTGSTLPLTAANLSCAPLLETVMLPLGVPTGVAAAMRTEIDAKTAPLDGVSAKMVLKLEPPIETSNPDGAATVTSSERLAPLTVKVCTVEGVPKIVVKAEKLETTATAGEEPTKPVTSTPSSTASDRIRILPVMLPLFAKLLIRTETVVLSSVPSLGLSVISSE